MSALFQIPGFPGLSLLQEFMSYSKQNANGNFFESSNCRVDEDGYLVNSISHIYNGLGFDLVRVMRNEKIVTRTLRGGWYSITLLTRCFGNDLNTSIFLSSNIPSVTMGKTTARVLEDVVVENGYNVLFELSPGDFRLGGFFSRMSKMKDEILEISPFLANPVRTKDHALELWKILMERGGPKVLSEIWNTLLYEEIVYRMKIIDPFCLDD